MLLIYGGEAVADAPALRTGGVPLVPDGFVWPECRECEGAMQFLAHLPLEFRVVAVFLSQNDPGMCDDWDATAGGNRAFLFTGQLAVASISPEGETVLGAVTALDIHPTPTGDVPVPERVLGRLGGEPHWLQDDETPNCPSCGTRMTFTAEIEEGHDFSAVSLRPRCANTCLHTTQA